MYRMLLILLYGSGLCIGEALNLTLRDVDVIERIITVRDTKFFKTRLVPIGPKLTGQLAVYIQQRRQLPLPSGDDSRLFTTKTGRGWPYPHVITLFHKVRRAAGIGSATGECRPPRIHDIRHNTETPITLSRGVQSTFRE
jgi:integrase